MPVVSVCPSRRWAILLLVLFSLGCAKELPTELERAEPTPDAFQPAAWEPGLYVGPIEGFTRGWHRLDPDAVLPLPRGVSVLVRCLVDASATLQWDGAREVDRDGATVTAEVRLEHGEVHEVTLTAVGTVEAPALYSCRFKGLADGATARLETVSLAAAPLFAGAPDGADPNMMAFFSGSNAVLHEAADGTYRTSVDRALELQARVSSILPASLIEWSVDGVPVALGATARFALATAGHHRIEARLASTTRALTVETYEVRIERIDDRAAQIEDGVPATFRAVTDPPGFEREVTWRADTPIGSAQPMVRDGDTFTVVFDQTWRTREDGRKFQWLGVRADNAVVTQDQLEEVNYGVREVAGQWWAYIETYDGQPLIAAPFELAAAALDTANITIVGYNESGLTSLENLPNLAQIALLQSGPAQTAAALWETGFPSFSGPQDQRELLDRLSQILKYIVRWVKAFLGPWAPNGCTNAPDFNFQDCCDDHDFCYCVGGKEADRLACDQALRSWIRARGHPILARIYYAAVRAFGKSHFNFDPC